MFIQYSHNKKYAAIVRTYRKEGKVRHERIMPLGPVRSEKDIERFEKILSDMKRGDEFVNLKDLSVNSSKEYGVAYTVSKLLEMYGLDAILKEELSKNKIKFDVFEFLKAMIVARIVAPSSDLETVDWIEKHYPKDLNVKNEHIYKVLDKLEEKKEIIEKFAFEALKAELDLDISKVHYDLTSSYVEGNCCEIAFLGYSRDDRPDRKQIVIALAMCDGIPILHEVYKGNTVDKTTLKDMQESLKKGLGIEKSTIVSDAGLMTNANLEHLEDEGYSYLFGMYRRNNNKSKELLKRSISSKKNQFAKEADSEIIERNGKKFTRRYIICLDNNTRKERLKTLEAIKKKRLKRLKELKTRYEDSQKSKGRKISKESCLKQAQNIVGAKNRFIDIKFEDTFEYSINSEKYDYEKKIAGKFLLVTNTEMSAPEAMKTYKELQTVERGFDEIKNFLDVRPIYHQKTRRIKAHVFVCVLAFLIECLIERKCKASARKVIGELETIKKVSLDTGRSEENYVSKLSDKSRDIFDELGMQKPLVRG